MNKSELINKLISENKNNKITSNIIKNIVREILDCMSTHLSQKHKIEIRGFGSFSLYYKSSRTCYHPKTGNILKLKSQYIIFFKPGKQLEIK
ncbi:integration host factor subunit beta [Enterobacteriaceae endosymbiont of Plateumaris consimilis]|uniref:HU family DNA-binding protein n=1 Tax=Enterobacteriaceae endosymbiont of Plateumaris consimilis TaxID=2675794 RepID=UPI001449689C|nr:HU family DNA-binding protein [Enterobacteriaceae endosymbiont of Plateumaris consimilis]QJC28697.1 integration host factor subunit beta [Enterobacteriaceae endosymbiont of Plateumaris consimilis]